MMWKLFLLVILAAVYSVQCATLGEKANEKYEQLLDMVKSSSDGVIAMNDSNYKKFILVKSREYKLALLYTASEARYKCSVCAEVEKEFGNVASTYKKAIFSTSLPAKDQIFFIRVDYKDSGKVFAKHGFQQVPAIVFMGPYDVRNPKQYEGNIEAGDRMKIDGAPNADAIAAFVNRKGKVNIEILKSALPKILFLCFLLAIIVIVGKTLIVNLESLKVIREYTNLWRFGCISLYGISISGVVYDIIRSPLPFYCKESGCIFFHPQSGQQFIVEGLIIGGLNLACAAICIWMYKYAPYQSAKSTRAGSVLMAAFGFFVLYSQVVALYRFKSSWYPYRLLF